MLGSLLLFLALTSAMQRASTFTGRFLFFTAVGDVTDSHLCLIFEKMPLVLSIACSFTLQLSFIAIPLVN
jgi:hypothetical protein